MTWMAYGFALAGTGLFVIPHDAGLGQLVAEARDAANVDHTRALLGLTLIVVGVLARRLRRCPGPQAPRLSRRRERWPPR